MYNVNIRPVLNGWTVEVGCQTVVFTSLDELLKEMKAYLEDPRATEVRYRKEGINSKHTFPTPEPQNPLQPQNPPGMVEAYDASRPEPAYGAAYAPNSRI